jgi:hypothetical protein
VLLEGLRWGLVQLQYASGCSDFDEQFAILHQLLDLGLDIYGYITLTGPDAVGIEDKIDALFDRLQALDINLPLRIIPLEIRSFLPMKERMKDLHHKSLDVQALAIAAWNACVAKRFESKVRNTAISNVPLVTRNRSRS